MNILRLCCFIILAIYSMPASEAQKSIINAIENRDHSGFQVALNRSPQKINNRIRKGRYEGYTPLMYAVLKRRNSFIEPLLDRGADPNMKNPDGNTPLMIMLASKNFEIADLLMERGADPFIKNDREETALMRVCLASTFKLMGYQRKMTAERIKADSIRSEKTIQKVRELLNKGFSVDDQSKAGYNALMFAAALGDPAVFNELLQHSTKKTMQVKDSNNVTIMHFAAQGGNLQIIDTLLSLGLPPNPETINCATPMMIAATYGELSAVHFFIAQGADYTVKNKHGVGLHYYAALWSWPGLADSLFRMSDYRIDPLSEEGRLILHTSFNKKDFKMDSLMYENIASISEANTFIEKAELLKETEGDKAARPFYRKAAKALDQALTEFKSIEKEYKKLRNKKSFDQAAGVIAYAGLAYMAYRDDPNNLNVFQVPGEAYPQKSSKYYDFLSKKYRGYANQTKSRLKTVME